MKQDYFQFYQIPLSFQIDKELLKRTFYRYSKKYHPDFHTLEDSTSQEAMLRLSSFNNEAYKTLKDFDLRMAYILKIKGCLEEEGQNKLSPDFLMEMMDINEALMELAPDPHDPARVALKEKIDGIEKELFDQIEDLVENFEDQAAVDLSPVVAYYFKKKYLLRLRSQFLVV